MWPCMLTMVGAVSILDCVMSVAIWGIVCCCFAVVAGFRWILDMENDAVDGIVMVVDCSVLLPVSLFGSCDVVIVIGVDCGKVVASWVHSPCRVWSIGVDWVPFWNRSVVWWCGSVGGVLVGVFGVVVMAGGGGMYVPGM